jgi:hypothetical protein
MIEYNYRGERCDNNSKSKWKNKKRDGW